MSCVSATTQAWYQNNTMFLQLGTLISLGDATDEPLTDELTGTVIVDASVTARVLDLAGTPVSGETWPVSLPHLAGGVYRGSVAAAVSVSRGVRFIVEITAVKDTSQAQWRVPVLVEERSE